MTSENESRTNRHLTYTPVDMRSLTPPMPRTVTADRAGNRTVTPNRSQVANRRVPTGNRPVPRRNLPVTATGPDKSRAEPGTRVTGSGANRVSTVAARFAGMQPRTCEQCGEPISADAKITKKTCSDRCRMALSRRLKREREAIAAIKQAKRLAPKPEKKPSIARKYFR